MIMPADDFLVGGLTAGIVVNDTEACHVDAHVRWGFVRAGAVNPFENRVEHREDIHIPVIVDSCFAVSFQVEGVNHVYIVKVRRGSFIGQVHRML